MSPLTYQFSITPVDNTALSPATAASLLLLISFPPCFFPAPCPTVECAHSHAASHCLYAQRPGSCQATPGTYETHEGIVGQSRIQKDPMADCCHPATHHVDVLIIIVFFPTRCRSFRRSRASCFSTILCLFPSLLFLLSAEFELLGCSAAALC